MEHKYASVPSMEHKYNTSIIKKLSFSAELIRKTHKILLQSNRGMTKQPGILRTNQVYIGSGGLQKKVTYMPPKASNVPALIESRKIL